MQKHTKRENTMIKKELLLTILEKLVKYWDKAEGLKLFVMSEYATAEDVNNILKFIQEKVRSLKKKQQTQHQQEKQNILKEKIAKAEEEEKSDLEDIELLLDTMEL
ncbi:MAG: hypothetical protein CR971_01515 [candidate division SR1 bacterium]|nr:MAG: hypothetical protein CR971_01515 [candidate division SR1 bacterium]